MKEVRRYVPGGERLGKGHYQDVIRRIHSRVEDSAISGAEQRALETTHTIGTVFPDGFTIKKAKMAGVVFTLGNKYDTCVSILIAEQFH
ncbi:MAG: hypothetical protein ACFFDI_13850 [Promethearchaeota archaeon]